MIHVILVNNTNFNEDEKGEKQITIYETNQK